MYAARPTATSAPGASLEGRDFVGGRIQVRRRIGHGSMGVVYEAMDGNRTVALKVLHRLQEIQVYRLKTEFRRLTQLNHPNVVCVYELFNEDGEWFFSMEHVHGSPIHRYLEQRHLILDERDYEAEFRSLLRQLIEGLAAIHEAGLVHRDIKPTNLLVTPEGRLVIVDFGLVSEQHAGGVGQTIDNRVSGTRGYIAPELLRGAPATASSDYYALGATLHLLITGRMPPHATHDSSESRRLTSPIGGLSRDLPTLCARLLSADPGDRPATRELLELCSEWPRPLQRARTASKPPGELFVGRDAELKQLAKVAANTRLGNASIALVHGTPGIGKSALLRKFVANMRADGAIVLVGRCSEWEAVPYKGMDEVIDQFSRLAIKMPRQQAAHLVPRHVAAVVRVFPALRRVEAFDAAAETCSDREDEPTLQRHAVMGIKDAFYRLAERHRVVLVVDDLHWADSDTVQLLADLFTPPAPPNMVLIGSVTAGASAHSLMQALSRAGSIASLTLDALSAEDSRDLALALLPDAQKAPETVEHVVRESNGIPLHLGELAEIPESLLRSGREETELLSQIVSHRIERLEPSARRLLELIAVSVHPLTLVLADACGVQHVQRALRQLIAERFVCSIASGNEVGFKPYSELVRRVLLSSMSPARLAEQHAALMNALESLREADPEWLLAHSRGAGHAEKIQRYSSLVVERARSGSACREQAPLPNQAVTHWMLSGHIVEGAEYLRRTLEAAGTDGPMGSARALGTLFAHRTLTCLRELAGRSQGLAQRLRSSDRFGNGPLGPLKLRRTIR